jgi:tetratricopeptide (TPR) repeat protein
MIQIRFTFLFVCISLCLLAQNDFEDNFNQGKEKFDKQQYTDAIDFFNKAIKNKSKAKNDYRIAQALQARAYCNMYLKKYSTAIKDMDEAIKLKPEYGDLYLSISMIYIANKQYDECIVWASKGLAIKPEFEELILFRASAKSAKKSYKEACLDYDTVLMINPKNIAALYLMAGTKEKIKEYSEALIYCTKAIEISPQDPAAFYNRGIAKAELKDFDGALEDTQRGMEVDSTTKWMGYNNIAFFIKFKQKDYQGALKYFDESIKLNPEFAYAYNNRGFAKIQLGDLKGARKDIEKSISMDPQNPYAFRTMALLLIAEKKENKVCEQLKKALDLGYADEYDDEVDNLIKEHCK